MPSLPMSTRDSLSSVYAKIYDLDLVYQSGCWQKCGDAHCCSFSRHKAKFRLLAKGAGQELPLLPGEFEFMEARGWTAQFQDFERKTFEYDFGSGTVTYDTIFSTRPHCACDHDTRTTVCRLYPLLPVYAPDGRLLGTEPLGIYEELEQLDRQPPVCQVSSLPFGQVNMFLDIANTLASHPVLLFHLMAYRIAKKHVTRRIEDMMTGNEASAFSLFERNFLRRKLFDHDTLKHELNALWQEMNRIDETGSTRESVLPVRQTIENVALTR